MKDTNTIGSTFIVNQKKSQFDLFYILALLNSRLMNYWYSKRYKTITQSINSYHTIPIKDTLEEQGNFVDIVRKILSLTCSNDHKMNETKKAQVKSLEKEIDQLVYKLYGLTEEEIKIIENTSQK